MRKDLQYLRYKTYEEWLAIRNSLTTLGGSDISTALGLNKNKHARRLFDEKLGLIPQMQEDNWATYSGKSLEDTIIEKYWNYYDPDMGIDSILSNSRAGIVPRKARRVKAIMINPKISHLSASIDREIIKKGGNGILEIKAPLSWVANQWEVVDPGYVQQVQAYMAITGYKWAEIFILKDGRFPDCFYIEANKELQSGVIELTREFYNLIERGREILKSNMPTSDKLMAIEMIAPQPDGSQAYEDYLKDRYKDGDCVNIVPGGAEELRLATRYLKAGQTIERIKEYQTLASNRLRNHMLKNRATAIKIANDNDITWKADKNNKATFRVSKKILEYGPITNI